MMLAMALDAGPVHDWPATHVPESGLQKPDEQSEAIEQVLLSAQGCAPSVSALPVPPQSMSVSLSFWTPSVGEGARHVHAPPGQLIGCPLVLGEVSGPE
jgi:hypothetical protein